MKKTYFFLLAVMQLSVGMAQQTMHLRTDFFIENRGQVRDQWGMPNEQVRFMFRKGQLAMQFRSDGFSYELYAYEPAQTRSEAGWPQTVERREDIDRVVSHRVDVFFRNASPTVRPVGEGLLPTYLHYYLAPVIQNRYEFVPTYGRIIYRDLYPGIDLVFYAPDALRPFPSYEMVVQPSADMSQIAFEYCGASSLEILPQGQFRMATPVGEITEDAPWYFVEHSLFSMRGAYELRGTTRFFSEAAYDRSKFLIIDPNLIWGTYYGGQGGDEVAEIHIGTDDRPIICGHTTSLNYIATSGAHQTTYGGGIYDYFLAKFSPDGNIYWATYFGGNDKDYCFAGAVDSQNDIYVGGNTESQGLATAGAFKTVIQGTAADNLIAKFKSNGQLVWSTYYGGAGSENIRSLVCDAEGYLYAAGTTYSDTGIATSGVYQSVKHNYDDGFVVKFTPGGQRVWGTYMGDSGVDRFHVVSLDLFGNCYAGGTTSSKKGVTTAGAHQTVYGGSTSDGLLCRFDTTGNLVWATYYGGNGEDRVRGLETDSQGYVYLAGFTNSENDISTPGCLQPEWASMNEGTLAEDNFLARFTPDGVRLWGTYYGGKGIENLWGADLDRKNHFLYVVGSTNSGSNMIYGQAMQAVKSTAADCFLGKFAFDGFPDWTTYWGGPVGQQFEDVDVDTAGFIYVCGRPTANDLLVTPGTHQAVFNGGYSETIVYKFSPFATCFDPFEPNNNWAQAKPLTVQPVGDTMIYGYLAAVDSLTDEDWYFFNVLPAYPHARIVVSNQAMNLVVRLYDSFGYELAQSNSTDLAADTISINNLNTMPFYLQVQSDDTLVLAEHCYRIRVFASDTPFVGGVIYTEVPRNVYERMHVYPNPARESCTLPVDELDTDIYWQVWTLSGRRILEGMTVRTPGTTSVQIPVSGLLPGPYTVHLSDRKHRKVYKLIVQ